MFHLAITRRHLLRSGAFAAIAPSLGIAAGVPAADPASAQSQGEAVWRHALSLFGDVKYPADFKRYDYVNPAAPKGGVARQISIGTFDNFNMAVSGVKGSLAPAAALINETLLARSQDEVAANYGLLYILFRLAEEFPGLAGLELGAGQSSLLLDALARAGRLASITTLEHDADWAARIGGRIAHDVLVAPLQPARLHGVDTQVYDVALGRRFDLVVVDGPVGAPHHSRWGALAVLDRHLADEFVVVFDDAERPGERQTIERFLTLRQETGHVFVHAMKSQCVVFTPKYRAVASY